MKALICTFLISFLITIQMFAQQPLKHLYLGNDTHTDLIWNGDEEYWYKLNLDMAKFYLNIGESTNSPRMTALT